MTVTIFRCGKGSFWSKDGFKEPILVIFPRKEIHKWYIMGSPDEKRKLMHRYITERMLLFYYDNENI